MTRVEECELSQEILPNKETRLFLCIHALQSQLDSPTTTWDYPIQWILYERSKTKPGISLPHIRLVGLTTKPYKEHSRKRLKELSIVIEDCASMLYPVKWVSSPPTAKAVDAGNCLRISSQAGHYRFSSRSSLSVLFSPNHLNSIFGSDRKWLNALICCSFHIVNKLKVLLVYMFMTIYNRCHHYPKERCPVLVPKALCAVWFKQEHTVRTQAMS